MSDNGGFLSRWSRLKRTAEPQPVEAEESQPEADAVPEVPEAEALSPQTLSEEELAALPRVEDLVAGSDIRAFMRPGVPSALRNAALRRIWMLTPAIRDYRDPAVDYAWDWNTPGGVPGDGCGPTAERAAEMLRNLVEPRAPKAETPVVTAEDDAAPEAEAVTEAAAAAETEPVMTAQAEAADSGAGDGAKVVPAADLSASEKSLDSQDKAGSDLPRRRHGGALPW